MRIQTNVAALRANHHLSQGSRAAQEAMGRLSSGARVARASDDPGGIAVANQLRAETRSLGAASRNVDQAAATLNTAEGAAASIQSLLTRMKELLVQAVSHTVSDGARDQLLAGEFEQARREIDRIAGSTEAQGRKLLDGSYSASVQVGTTAAAGQQIGLAISNLTTAGLGVDFAIPPSVPPGFRMGEVDAAIGTVGTALATMGAQQSRLAMAQENARTSMQNLAAAESSIRDLDVVDEVMRLYRAQTVQQSATSVLARAHQSSDGVLSLFRALPGG